MTKVLIYSRNLSPAEVDSLRHLLSKAGCNPARIEVIDLIEQPDDEADEEIIVCLLTPDLVSDPELEQGLLRGIDGGRRVIAIWQEGAPQTGAPASVLKYCYSIVPWDTDRVRAVMRDDDFICFETATGQPLEMPEPERRVCPEK
jgi:hypothetical protein